MSPDPPKKTMALVGPYSPERLWVLKIKMPPSKGPYLLPRNLTPVHRNRFLKLINFSPIHSNTPTDGTYSNILQTLALQRLTPKVFWQRGWRAGISSRLTESFKNFAILSFFFFNPRLCFLGDRQSLVRARTTLECNTNTDSDLPPQPAALVLSAAFPPHFPSVWLWHMNVSFPLSVLIFVFICKMRNWGFLHRRIMWDWA